MRLWKPRLWVAALIILTAILGGMGYGIYCWYESDLIWLFFTIIGVEVLLFAVITLCVRETRYLHFHHYTIGMCAIAILGVQKPFLSFLTGFSNGVMIEGGSRWGYDPIWIKRTNQENQ